jgi:hypothetical protein
MNYPKNKRMLPKALRFFEADVPNAQRYNIMQHSCKKYSVKLWIFWNGCSGIFKIE